MRLKPRTFLGEPILGAASHCLERFGYRRIHALLRKQRITTSEKVIRRIMKDGNIIVKVKKTQRYNSYKGEISPAVRI